MVLNYVSDVMNQCSTTGVTKAVVCAIISRGMVHIKEPLQLIRKSSPCSGGSGFPLSLCILSFTIYPTPYNCKQNMLSASLNNTFLLSNM